MDRFDLGSLAMKTLLERAVQRQASSLVSAAVAGLSALSATVFAAESDVVDDADAAGDGAGAFEQHISTSGLRFRLMKTARMTMNVTRGVDEQLFQIHLPILRSSSFHDIDRRQSLSGTRERTIRVSRSS